MITENSEVTHTEVPDWKGTVTVGVEINGQGRWKMKLPIADKEWDTYIFVVWHRGTRIGGNEVPSKGWFPESSLVAVPSPCSCEWTRNGKVRLSVCTSCLL